MVLPPETYQAERCNFFLLPYNGRTKYCCPETLFNKLQEVCAVCFIMLIFKLHVNVNHQIHHDVRTLNHLLQSWNIDHTLSESPDADQTTISNMAHLSWSIESALNQMLRSRSINIPSLCDSHTPSRTSLLSRQHAKKVTLYRNK